MDFSNPVAINNSMIMQDNNIANQQIVQNFMVQSQRFNDECLRNNMVNEPSKFEKVFKVDPKLKEKMSEKNNPTQDAFVKADCRDNRVGGMTPDGKLWDGVRVS